MTECVAPETYIFRLKAPISLRLLASKIALTCLWRYIQRQAHKMDNTVHDRFLLQIEAGIEILLCQALSQESWLWLSETRTFQSWVQPKFTCVTSKHHNSCITIEPCRQISTGLHSPSHMRSGGTIKIGNIGQTTGFIASLSYSRSGMLIKMLSWNDISSQKYPFLDGICCRGTMGVLDAETR